MSAVTDTGVTLTGTPPRIQAGQILVSGQGAGLIRRVTQTTPSGTGVTLVTENASLTDVFASASVQFRRGIRMSDVQSVQPLVDGVVIGGSRGRADVDIPVTLPKTFVGVQQGNLKFGVEAAASGNLNIGLTGRINITLANGLELLEIIQESGWNGTYSLSLKGQVDTSNLIQKEIPFATIIFSPIPLGAIGPVPIVLLPVLFFQTAILGTVVGGWETTGNGNADYQVGIRYVQDPPGSSFSVDKIIPIAAASHTGTFNTSNFFGSLKVDVTPIQPALETSFDGLIGPTLKADLPALSGEIKVNNGNSVDITADAVFRAKVGAKAGMFGFSLPLFEVTVAEKKFNIFKHTFAAGTGNVGVH